MKKRIFSRVLALVMAMSLLSTTAFAASFSQLQDAIDGNGGYDLGGGRYGYGDQIADSSNYAIEAWEDNGTRNVQLNESVSYQKGDTNNSATISDNKDITLDLNGQTILGENWKGTATLTVKGEDTSLTLKDTTGGGAISGGNGTANGVVVDGGASFTMESGAITGFSSHGGTGVTVKEGDFTMTGGEITQNMQSGVAVNGANSSFTMEGGEISGNKSTNGAGGVRVSNNAQFTMNGGEITGNTGLGGGVGVQTDATFNMTGGSITHNTAKDGGGGISAWLGNIYLSADEGKEIIISENESKGHGGGISSLMGEKNTVTIDGVILDGNKATGAGAMGGAIRISGDIVQPVNISNTIMRNNKAGSNVGNTLRLTDGEFNITNCTIENESEDENSGYELSNSWGGKVNFTETTMPGNTIIEQGIYFSNNGFTVFLDEENSLTITDREGNPVEAILDGNGKRIEAGKQDTEPNIWNVYEIELIIPFSAIPAPDVPGGEENPSEPDFGGVMDGADFTPDAATTTIEDEETPLAGLISTAELLEALRQYEGVEDVELPEDFQWIDHDYAQAIYWGLDEALVIDTEDEPFDPDEIVTVALLREVLENFVEYKGADLTVTVEGEDDMIVMDLGERLTVFYSELEAALADQAA